MKDASEILGSEKRRSSKIIRKGLQSFHCRKSSSENESRHIFLSSKHAEQTRSCKGTSDV
jgi:hypothetical protein